MENGNLKETMRDVLENNILSYWLTKVKDEEMVALRTCRR